MLSSSSSPPNIESDGEKDSNKSTTLLKSQFFEWVSKNFAHPLNGMSEGGDFESAIYYERESRLLVAEYFFPNHLNLIKYLHFMVYLIDIIEIQYFVKMHKKSTSK